MDDYVALLNAAAAATQPDTRPAGPYQLSGTSITFTVPR